MRLKRTVDVIVAIFGLFTTWPVLLVSALAVKLDSRGPVLYRSTRVGQSGTHFTLLKLRSMRQEHAESPSRLTVADDPRVTRVGRILRATGLDGLPQLINVLKGDMSLVGPRPEDPRFVAMYGPSERRVLSVRPGITSPASIAYGHEEALLMGSDAAEQYTRFILPKKVAMDLEYVWSRSFRSDLRIVFRTIFTLMRELRIPEPLRRHVPWYLIDGLVVVVCFFATYYLRFLDTTIVGDAAAPQLLAIKLLPIALVYIVVNQLAWLNSRVWTYATAAEVLAVARSSGIATAIVLVADIAVGWGGARPLPLSVVVAGGFLTFSGFVGTRYRSRLLTGSWRKRQLNANRPTWAARTLIYGAGEEGQLVAWRLLTLSEGYEYDLVGFLDDDKQKVGRKIHGIPVLGGRRDLDRLVTSERVDLIVLSMHNVSGDELRSILTTAQETSAKIRIAPNQFEWMSSTSGAPLREVRPEDLLGRKPSGGPTAGGGELVAGQAVLVTGAAGSIGSELCRLLAALAPRTLVALDSNESGLFDLATELRAATGSIRLETVIADVTQEGCIGRAFQQFRPDVVFHVAAYKHVPLLEDFPDEAARVNILGTWKVLGAARAAGTRRFVFVSTDKAVNPTSVMGATKRIAEQLVLAEVTAPLGPQPQSPTRCTAVRFGNVLGSRGSVVPTFAKQIAMGGPVTITDSRMTRYFMDVSEAAGLIIQAAVQTTDRDIFMLDMGEEIRVDDLARKMIRMRGLRPGVDIEIVYTGMRPGEKLQEELHDLMENRQPTSHPLIYRLTDGDQLTEQAASDVVKAVLHLIESPDRCEIASALFALAAKSNLDVHLPRPPEVEKGRTTTFDMTPATSEA